MTDAALAVRGALVVAMDAARTVAVRDVLVGHDGRIADVRAPGSPLAADRTIEAAGLVLVPGLVQAHLHLCQTLFRGMAEDRTLLRWLRERIWPLEAAHDEASLRASARLGMAELLLSGTTAVLDMGTVHHTDVLFEAACESGLRYTGGKAMMDTGDGVPPGLLEDTAGSLLESDRLAERWHDTEGGRLRYAYSPRFVLSCTPDLLRSVAARAQLDGMVVHTHASEQRQEADLVRQRHGQPNIQLLGSLGLAAERCCLAHCVWPESHEMDVLAQGGATVVHCPSCNMKLGSGVAPIAGYVDMGVNVAIGADGAASNNRLDGWEELRLTGLLAKLRNGAEALPASVVFEMATLGGARGLGLDAEIGSVEVGKCADLLLLDLRAPHVAGALDVYTQLVYSARASDVRTVLVDGRVLVDDGTLTTLDRAAVVAEAEHQAEVVARRAGIALTA